MDIKFRFFLICVAFFIISEPVGAAEEQIPEVSGPPGQKAIVVSGEQPGEEKTWAVESTQRQEQRYPSNWGQVGIFRVRSAESLPTDTLTFGIGGEFYSTRDAPLFYGTSDTSTIAESIFVGYSPIERLTLGVMRKNSSTTFGTPKRLISSLGDLNFTGMYSLPLTDAISIAPIVNVLIASNFNELTPSGNTLSAGIGAATTISLYPQLGIPLFVHGNLLYHSPQIRTTKVGPVEPEAFFNFSRFHTMTFGLGAEYWLGDFAPFLEFYNTFEVNTPLRFFDHPSKISIGTRITPINNKSLALLIGTDIGLGRGLVSGVPYTPPYQIIGQVSYTVGLTQTERKHYYTTKDVNVVDRKFVLSTQVRFKINSAELDPASSGLLNQIATVVKNNNVKKLLIVGHTDSTASEGYNSKLSQARAQTVKAYLVSRGIAEETLMTQGYGKRKPIASNLTESGRSLNRRVEFFIIE